jgi:hypothetical protein
MSELLLQFSTSPAFASSIIRRLTHSPFSHVDIILPGEGLLGVSGPDNDIGDPGGVMIRSFNAWPYLTLPKVAKLRGPEDKIRTAIDWTRSQIGKPFDHAALWHFLDDLAEKPKRNWRDENSWICSEISCRAIEISGLLSYSLLAIKERISPGDLLLIVNPLMSEGNINEFLGIGLDK